jgi:lipopolysaccharide export system ATP-binding protein
MPLLEVRGLVKYYGRRCVVNGVCFQVEPGEVVGLLGPNGAGKTTSFRMTTGQITPNDGQVWFNGQDVTLLPMYRRARLGMGYLSQETSVFRKLTVEQNILAILEILPICRSVGRKLTRAERWERTEMVLEQFGLTRVRKNPAARLSGGEKRRLEIARCLVCEPLLILLDEPFTGIDPITIADIRQVVRDLRDQGIGILLTDHNVREALKITDRSYLIKDGKVRTHGSPQHIVTDPIAISEYLGQGFNDDFIGSMPGSQPAPAGQAARLATPEPAAVDKQAGDAPEPEFNMQQMLEQERIHRLLEGLQADNPAESIAELLKSGPAAVPALTEALQRRDVDTRAQAHMLLQQILGMPIPFDPYAPEVQRRQQLRMLHEQFTRKAG